jgi:hypothetical protein
MTLSSTLPRPPRIGHAELGPGVVPDEAQLAPAVLHPPTTVEEIEVVRSVGDGHGRTCAFVI